MIKLELQQSEPKNLTIDSIHELGALLGKPIVGYKSFLQDESGEGTDFQRLYFDVLAEYNKSTVWVEWKWLPEDIEWPLQQNLEGHSFSVISSEDNDDYIAYNIEFEIDGTREKLTVNFADPNEWLDRVNARLGDKELVDINFGDDQYTWLLVDKPFDVQKFCEITGANIDTIQRIGQNLQPRKVEGLVSNPPVPKYIKASLNTESPVDEKIFFNLHMKATGPHGKSLYLWFSQSGQQAYFAGRALPGGTLKAAISMELENYLGIKEWQFEGPPVFSDLTTDKEGKEVTRYNVYLRVPYFEISDQKVIGMDMQWAEDSQETPANFYQN